MFSRGGGGGNSRAPTPLYETLHTHTNTNTHTPKSILIKTPTFVQYSCCGPHNVREHNVFYSIAIPVRGEWGWGGVVRGVGG